MDGVVVLALIRAAIAFATASRESGGAAAKAAVERMGAVAVEMARRAASRAWARQPAAEVRLQLRDRGPRRRNDFPGLRDRAAGLGQEIGQEDGPRQRPSHRVPFTKYRREGLQRSLARGEEVGPRPTRSHRCNPLSVPTCRNSVPDAERLPPPPPSLVALPGTCVDGVYDSSRGPATALRTA